MRSLIILSLSVLACDSPDGNSGSKGDVCTMPGNVCATPTCSQFPTQADCDYVMPTNAYCPLVRPHCFDPSRIAGYCDPMVAICGALKMGAMCPQPLCTAADVKSCYDTNNLVFCKDIYRCIPFGCMDGGTDGGDLGGGGDGGALDVGLPDLPLLG